MATLSVTTNTTSQITIQTSDYGSGAGDSFTFFATGSATQGSNQLGEAGMGVWYHGAAGYKATPSTTYDSYQVDAAWDTANGDGAFYTWDVEQGVSCSGGGSAFGVADSSNAACQIVHTKGPTGSSLVEGFWVIWANGRHAVTKKASGSGQYPEMGIRSGYITTTITPSGTNPQWAYSGTHLGVVFVGQHAVGMGGATGAQSFTGNCGFAYTGQYTGSGGSIGATPLSALIAVSGYDNLVTSSLLTAMSNDYLTHSTALTVTTGGKTTSGTDLYGTASTAWTDGYDPQRGAYIIAASGNHVNLGGSTATAWGIDGTTVTARFSPCFIITGWTDSAATPTITYNGTALVSGMDFIAYNDTTAQVLWLCLLFDIGTGGKRTSSNASGVGALDITAGSSGGPVTITAAVQLGGQGAVLPLLLQTVAVSLGGQSSATPLLVPTVAAQGGGQGSAAGILTPSVAGSGGLVTPAAAALAALVPSVAASGGGQTAATPLLTAGAAVVLGVQSAGTHPGGLVVPLTALAQGGLTDAAAAQLVATALSGAGLQQTAAQGAPSLVLQALVEAGQQATATPIVGGLTTVSAVGLLGLQALAQPALVPVAGARGGLQQTATAILATTLAAAGGAQQAAGLTVIPSASMAGGLAGVLVGAPLALTLSVSDLLGLEAQATPTIGSLITATALAQAGLQSVATAVLVTAAQAASGLQTAGHPLLGLPVAASAGGLQAALSAPPMLVLAAPASGGLSGLGQPSLLLVAPTMGGVQTRASATLTGIVAVTALAQGGVQSLAVLTFRPLLIGRLAALLRLLQPVAVVAARQPIAAVHAVQPIALIAGEQSMLVIAGNVPPAAPVTLQDSANGNAAVDLTTATGVTAQLYRWQNGQRVAQWGTPRPLTPQAPLSAGQATIPFQSGDFSQAGTCELWITVTYPTGPLTTVQPVIVQVEALP